MENVFNRNIQKINYKKLFSNKYVNKTVVNNIDIIWITIINSAYIDFTLNFLESMKRSNCKFKLIIYFIGEEGIDAFDGNDKCILVNAAGILEKREINSEMSDFASLNFRRICFAKLDVIKYTFLKYTQSEYVGYIDTDIVLFSDPTKLVLDIFNKNKNINIVFQCDEYGYYCSNKNKCGNLCGGIMIYKKSNEILALFEYKEDDILKYTSDQEYLNKIISEQNILTETIQRIVFVNGAYPNIFNGTIPKGCCLIHFNYLISHQKKQKMQELGLWYINERQYIMTLNKWQKTTKNIQDLIVQGSTRDGGDNWQPFPIGMCFQYIWNYKNTGIQIGAHNNTVLLAINIHNDYKRRPTGINRHSIVEILKRKAIKNISLEHQEYFEALPTYKFVISPEGNGIDCHRHYESLLAGSIPIIEHNPLTEEKYKGCPVLFTVDYSEITEEYLISKYNKMLNTTYDFSRLFLSNYSESIQNEIKKCGNYWTEKHTGMAFYNTCQYRS